ncbi:hypothetical protein SESBI_00390 [Sesbania bispinosa]|nr:hypothetical protein SESBI_00390 [Sesbania bispinosa]
MYEESEAHLPHLGTPLYLLKTQTTTPPPIFPRPSSHATWIGNCPIGAESTNVSSVTYDPLLHLNLQAPPQGAALHPLPHGYTIASGNDFVFGEGDAIEGSGVAYQDGDGRDFGNGVLEFTQDVTYVGKKRGGKRVKQFTSTSEKQKRVDLSRKFDALKELIPNP